jgi:flagellar biosynthetic protein FliR
MALLPAFGEQTVPQRVRLSLAFAFTLIVAPAAGEMPPQETSFVGNLFAETVVGLALGAAVRLYILALQTAGAIAANATSLAQLFGGAGPEPQPAISNLLVMAALAVAVAAGLHVQIAQALVISYDAFPAGQLPASGEMAKWGVAQISSAFSMGFTLAAPFTIAAFLYNLALGVINRAMPSLMVSFIGAPALAGGGLILVALVSPAILIIWSQSFSAFLAMPFGAAP